MTRSLSFSLFTKIWFSKHCCVTEILRVEILCFFALCMSCIPNNWQFKRLIFWLNTSEHFLEAFWERLEFCRVAKVWLQNSRSYLDILYMTEEGSI